MNMLIKVARKIKKVFFDNSKTLKTGASNMSSSEYWTVNNVTLHKQFATREESNKFLRWRFDQYPNYEKLMPCSGFDGKVVLDYGCGPGHDVIGFVEYSRPASVIAMDVSETSLQETEKRVELHEASAVVKTMLIKEGTKISLPDNSVDYIHTSGVLHHTPNMAEILVELKRILKPDGFMRVMVYNYNSIWSQLYVPYILQIKRNLYTGVDHAEAFKRSTDGEDCPISNCYTPEEFIGICKEAGFSGKFLGAGISLDELIWCSDFRIQAMQDICLPEKYRNFLKDLTFNEFNQPLYKGEIAGIDAVYEFRK